MERLGVVRLTQIAFGALVALITVLACGAAVMMVSGSSDFARYRAIAQEALAANALLEDLTEARLAATKFRIAADPAHLAAARNNLAEIEIEAAALPDDPSPALLALGQSLQRDALAYGDTLADAAAAAQARDAALSQAIKAGDAALGRLAKVASTLAFSGDPATAHVIMQAAFRAATTRARVERGFSGLAEVDITAAQADLLRIAALIGDRSGVVRDATQRQRLNDAAGELTALAEDIAAAQAASAAFHAAYAEGMDVLGPAMQQRADETAEAIMDRQNTLGPALTRAFSRKLALLAVGAVVVVGAGAALAWLVARQARAALHRLTGAMGRVAAGDLDAAIEGADHPSEIGDMARALAGFRDAARAERDAAADAAAHAEAREAFQKAFASVAEASTRGDFSARIEQRFAIDELNTLAGSINALMQTVSDGVRETGSVIAALAEGDLSRRMNGQFSGAFATLQRDVNATMEKLETLIGAVAASSAEIDGATGEIAAAARDVSARAEQQAASLEETAAAMEQMSANVRSSAENADRANSLAGDAAGRADNGRAVVGAATEAMDAIQTSSARIADIVGAIDSIAFTTNLLALNASVEAARAGEAGKGFAVVAGEVRTLAQRSADSAREIRELIDGSVAQVESGAEKVRETERALAAIAESVVALNGAIAEISAGMREQATGIGEVTTAVTGMDQITQSNAAQAEQSAASAASLADLSRKLRGDVAAFTGARRGYAHAAE